MATTVKIRKCILLLLFISIYTSGYFCEGLEDSQYWQNLGLKTIQEKIRLQRTIGIAKNVILFVGDGMGLSHITPGRIFKGQLEGKSGEEGSLYFETFPYTSLSKTYCVDRQVPDSAATATALFAGVKSNYETLGLDASSTFNVCDPDVQEKAKVTTIIDWAIAAGKSTGVVTTARVTHATPAAAYSHCPSRNWECDSAIPLPQRGKGCKDIARQLIEDEPGQNINVILGGGRQPLGNTAAQNFSSDVCHRDDGRNLVEEWEKIQSNLNRNYQYVSNKGELLKANDNVTHLLGLFADSHMSYDKDRDLSDLGEPSLSEMVSKAIDLLKKNIRGFVLIVEGAKIDLASHDNYAKIAMEELVAMDAAVETARNKTNERDTLVIVTADHSHSLAMNGYPKRGNPIEGIGDVTPEGFAYQTLSYINGPAYNIHRVQSNDDAKASLKSVHTWVNLNKTEGVTERYFRHHAGYWMDLETHGGEDVPVYAVGPYAHLLSGVNEQTHIAYTVAYSARIGPFA